MNPSLWQGASHTDSVLLLVCVRIPLKGSGVHGVHTRPCGPHIPGPIPVDITVGNLPVLIDPVGQDETLSVWSTTTPTGLSETLTTASTFLPTLVGIVCVVLQIEVVRLNEDQGLSEPAGSPAGSHSVTVSATGDTVAPRASPIRFSPLSWSRSTPTAFLSAWSTSSSVGANERDGAH